MTVTIDLPDALAAQLAALPDVNAFATAVLQAAINRDEAAEIDEEAVAGIAEGIADIEAGRTRPLPEFIAEQEAFWQSRK